MTDLRNLAFSNRLSVCLAIARGLAAGRGDTDVTQVHIALGILREGENGAIAALQHAKVSLSALRGDLEELLGERRGKPRFQEVVVPLTEGETRVVRAAHVEAQLLDDKFLGPQHLLLAILRDAEGQAARAFRRRGVEHASALTHLAAVTIKHDHSAHAV